MSKLSNFLKKDGVLFKFRILIGIFLIIILFIIVGIFVDQNMDNSTNLAIKHIEKKALDYINDYSDDIVWDEIKDKSDKDTGNELGCVPIDILVKKGFLKKSEIVGIGHIHHVMIIRNQDKKIVENKVDKKEQCTLSKYRRAVIPTAKEFCKDSVYIPNKTQVLTNVAEGYTFINNTATSAGTYVIDTKLNNRYIWSDDTIEQKKITCKIKKATPKLELSLQGEDGNNLNPTSLILKSNVSGKISLESSNSEIATASISNTVSASSFEIKIQKLVVSKEITYITIHFTPDDNKNYKTTSIVYTIGSVSKKKVKVPTNKFCENNTFNDELQVITKKASEGYQFYNNEQKEIGSYDVRVKLDYGYEWDVEDKDGKTSDKTIKCNIVVPEIVVKYDVDGGYGCKDFKVTYLGTYGDLCKTERDGYTFVGWYTEPFGGTEIKSNTKVSNYNNHIIYAQYKPKNLTVTFRRNSSTADTVSTMQTFTFGKLNQSFDSKITRVGYNLIGWTENINMLDMVEYSVNANVLDNWIEEKAPSVTLYAIWAPKTVTVTLNRNSSKKDKEFVTQTFIYGEENKIFDSGFTVDGKTLLGWATDKDATKVEFSSVGDIPGDWIDKNAPSTTLYAIWK